MGVSKNHDHIQVRIKMQNPSQEHPGSSKAPNKDLKDTDVLCNFKIKTESQNSGYLCIRDHWPYQNQDQITKPHSGSYSVLQSPKSGPKGHGCSLHLQNQDREPKFWIWVNQIPVNKSKSMSGYKIPNIGFLSQFWRCKEHLCPLGPDLGLWRILEVPDCWSFHVWNLGSLSWIWRWKNIHVL